MQRPLTARHGERYDPRVRLRLEESANVEAADYIAAVKLRDTAIELFDQSTRPFDAVIAPTVAVSSPRFDELENEVDHRRMNRIVRRDPAGFNTLDRGVLTSTCHEPGELPVGLMVVGESGPDARLLSIGTALERALA